MIRDFTLECIRGKRKGHSYTFSGDGVYQIGRKRVCDLALPDATVSGLHCTLTGDGHELRIRDNDSTNGTCVGDKPVRETVLRDGDRITLGECVLQLSIRQEEEDSHPPFMTIRTVPGDAGGAQAVPDARQAYEEKAPKGGKSRRESGEAPAAGAKMRPDAGGGSPQSVIIRPDAGGGSPQGVKMRSAGNPAGAESGAGGESEELCRCELCGRSFPAAERVEGLNICPHCMEHDEEAVLRFLLADTPAKNEEPEVSALGVPGYRCLRKLGEGSFGAVWLVEEAATGRRMALKTMLERAMLQELERRKFDREMQIAAQLRHPNIVGLYESGCADGRYYMLQEFCAGGSLLSFIDRTWIRYAGKLPVELAVNLELQLLDALDYAHNAEIRAVDFSGKTEILHGVVHRDIHPGNIFLAGHSEPLQVKVGDWGLAKAYELAGLSGISVGDVPTGTQDFACMQQHMNFRYSGPEVDVWSAAAVLYFMLSGQPPRGRDALSRMSFGQFPKVQSIRNFRRDIPDALADALDYTLAEQPRLRVLSADELRGRIRDAMK
ncbi:MAG: protein kinase [Eubacteriales bacterium]|nr:protein kinase [Eubacteriales bacterium]